jgi:hypothetical protein
MTTEYSVAVWYVNDEARAAYDLFHTEPDAALSAAGLEFSQGRGSVLGVQFADGRLVPATDWSALEVGRQRRREFEAARAAAVDAEVFRTVRDPFTSAEVEVTGDDPAWLGLPGKQMPEMA